MASQSDIKPRQVAIVAWNGMDLTDFTAPLEVLSHARNADREQLYRATIVAEAELSSTSQRASISRHMDVARFIQDAKDYNILIIPGGGGFSADSVPKADAVDKAIEAFQTLPSDPQNPRIIMSICAGSFFLAQAGLLKGKLVTGHPFYLGELKKLCERNGGSHVLRQHYVDGGLTSNNIRVITSGGITSGFDSTLYLVELEQGLECANRAQAVMDASWRREALPFGFV